MSGDEIACTDHLPTRTSRIASWIRRSIIIAAGVVLVSAIAVDWARAAPPLQLVYRISHSIVGDIGSYTCTVEPLVDGAVQVQVRELINVKMLGLPFYSMAAAETERWQGSRLVSFDAVSDKPNGRVEVKGEARGDRFVITSPRGRVTATATVHPAEPCARNFLQSTMVLRPDTGDLEEVQVTGGDAASMIIDGTPVPVRKYNLDGTARYTVWLDARNLPVMFVIHNSTGEATFTLTKCISCRAMDYRLGMK